MWCPIFDGADVSELTPPSVHKDLTPCFQSRWPRQADFLAKCNKTRVRPQLARKRIVADRHDPRVAFLVGAIKPLEGLVGIAAECIHCRYLKRHIVAVA